MTVPQSSVSVSSSMTAPQRSAMTQSSTSSATTQPKPSFLSSLNPFSKKANQLTPDIIEYKSKLLEDIQRSILSNANKNKLMKTLNKSTSSNIVQRLNNAYKELNKLKSQ